VVAEINTDTWIAIGAIMSGCGSFTMGLMALRAAKKEQDTSAAPTTLDGDHSHEIAEPSDTADGGVG
jgi:uncharacterized protein YceK